ncbi:MAG: hypothetical protein U0270_17675 [Labilithrix sp.]
MRAFALREGIRPRRLYWWTRRLGDSNVRDVNAVRFVPAIVTSAVAHKGGGARAAIVVRVGPTATVEVEESVSAGWVAELMTELERLACS